MTAKKGKKFYEIFKIEKKGKEKTVKKTGYLTEKKPAKKQITNENKILRNILIAVGIIIISVLAYMVFAYKASHFSYKGVDFTTVEFCDAKPCLILYQTKLPVTMSSGEKAEYNFYLRNDPRELDKIVFDGDVNFLPNMVIGAQGNFSCDGDGIIALANMAKLYEIVGAKVIKNEELKCNLNNEYLHLDIQEGQETKIIQATYSCYVLRVNNCEILPVTERYMLETLIKINEILESNNSPQ
ncbi:hypothetical protein COU59_00155 [Candidatus Pacearchaeota archaeon CG10_big_fil_rev_8_21_14_0_10_34_12]|nr:MAG: hypothetical protein COU59_00155 [Candidatus Pacearchaeota archaeon CG10_big_fil_rev_8_21_14_0_10_34_12]